ncbi:MAG: hypothetical protein AUJ55_01530 [Proteobacteria bacterium CG1_02_64_396]|nr:MAG: hypothetical protein AUJ55_01530 [Proteobacteria bacterium CG1_02_64_396]
MPASPKVQAPDPLFPYPARLVERIDMGPDQAMFTFAPEEPGFPCPDGRNHEPGQFLMLSVPPAGEAPFTICAAPRRGAPGVQTTIRRVGRVTRRLFELPVGARVGLRGPFGRPYPVAKMAGLDLVFVAGGLGIAPLRGLIEHTLGDPASYGRQHLIYGMREGGQLLYGDQWRAARDAETLSLDLRADENLPGDFNSGGVLDAIEAWDWQPERTAVAVCGPPVMYPPVLQRLQALKVWPQRIFVTLERRMVCGIGQCGHCAIGYRYTCTDGPVFSAWEARGLREAWEEPKERP